MICSSQNWGKCQQPLQSGAKKGTLFAKLFNVNLFGRIRKLVVSGKLNHYLSMVDKTTTGLVIHRDPENLYL